MNPLPLPHFPLPPPFPPPDDDAHVGEGEEEEVSWCVGNPGTVLDELAGEGGTGVWIRAQTSRPPRGEGEGGYGEEEEDL